MTAAPTPTAPATRPGRRDAAIAVALAFAATAAYAALLQERFFGDGPGLVDFLATGTGRSYNHSLYLPFARVVLAVVGPFVAHPADAAVLAMGLASAVPGGIAVGAGWLVLRALGCTAAQSAFGLALVAWAPAWLFFSTVVEVHALHSAAVAIGAAAVLLVPWRRRWLGVSTTAVAIALAYGTHQTGMSLGLGFLLLAQVAAVRQGVPIRVVPLFFVVGPILFAALVASWMGASVLRFGEIDFARELGRSVEQAGSGTAGVGSRVSEFVAAIAMLGLLLPAMVAGLVLRRPRGWGSAMLVAFVGVPWTAYFLWGVMEGGAYFMPVLPIAAWPAARLLSPRARTKALVLAATAVVVQASLALVHRDRVDDGFTLASRNVLVERALGGPDSTPRGRILTLVSYAPRADLWHPGVVESPMQMSLAIAGLTGSTPDDVRASTRAMAVLLAEGPVAFDATFLSVWDDVSRTPFAPYLAAAAEGVREHFEIAEFERGRWRLWRLERAR